MNPILQDLSHYKPKSLENTPHEAAVMVLLLTKINDGEMDIVITKRSDTLPTYAGHYSFPGGMRDESDHDLYATAARETFEELNIQPNDYDLITQLDDFLDHSANRVRPFVSVMKEEVFKKTYKASPDEISAIYYFPISKLPLIKDEPRLHKLTQRRPSYVFEEQGVFIWGLTASILVHFYNIIAHKQLPLGKKLS